LDPRSDHYDAVIVGAGLGGLSAAACLAKIGKSVLLVERQDGPGGNAHAFTRGPYTFDPAIHITAHGFNVEFLGWYLEALGADAAVDLMLLEPLYSVETEGSRFEFPVGVEPLTEYFAELFPAEADGIRQYFQICADTTRESQAPPPRVAVKDLESMMAALPLLFRYRMETLGSVIDQFVTDPEARSLLGAQWPYMGLPPSKLSFLTGTGVWMALMELGPVYVRGSFQKLADAIAQVVEHNGGEILFERSVARISAADGAVKGVVLDDGREIRADVVVSNADAKHTFEQLVGLEHLPERYVKRLKRMRPSVSAVMIYSACTLPVQDSGLAGETFVYDHWDHDETWADVEAGRLGGMWLSVPTLHDQSLAPEGEHLVMLTSLIPYDIGEPWSDAKPRYEQLLVDRADKLLPGYRDSITFIESATPETFERYTLAQNGAIYGWENTPQQTQPKRLPFETPIDGLYLAGHWTDPGTGSVRCLLSGLRAAAAIAGEEDPFAFLQKLEKLQPT
jgi:phytoene desaturase